MRPSTTELCGEIRGSSIRRKYWSIPRYRFEGVPGMSTAFSLNSGKDASRWPAKEAGLPVGTDSPKPNRRWGEYSRTTFRWIGKRVLAMSEAEKIPGYTFGSQELSRSRVTLQELENLNITAGFTEETERYLRMAGEVLSDKTKEIVERWRNSVKIVQTGGNPVATPRLRSRECAGPHRPTPATDSGCYWRCSATDSDHNQSARDEFPVCDRNPDPPPHPPAVPGRLPK